MASEAFDALRTARLQGKAPAGSNLSFSDLLDTINPLQHIPVVAQIYRHVTGDTISPEARVAGGALYGGPFGLVASVVDAAVAAVSGSDLGEHFIAGIFGDDKTPAVATAAAKTPLAPPVPETLASKTPAPETKVALAAAPQLPPKPEAPPVTATPKTLAARPVPQLSSEAFNALIGSFSNPDAAKAANPAMTQALAKPASPAPATTPPPIATASAMSTGKPTDLLGAMQSGLDQLDAMKRKGDQPASPSLPPVADASGKTGGL